MCSTESNFKQDDNYHFTLIAFEGPSKKVYHFNMPAHVSVSSESLKMGIKTNNGLIVRKKSGKKVAFSVTLPHSSHLKGFSIRRVLPVTVAFLPDILS